MDLKISEGDLEIIGGEVSYVTGIDARAQEVEYRLRSWLGENIYDQAIGGPWLQLFEGHDATGSEIGIAAEATALTLRGVISASVQGVVISGSTATITMTVETVDGAIDFSTEITI